MLPDFPKAILVLLPILLSVAIGCGGGTDDRAKPSLSPEREQLRAELENTIADVERRLDELHSDMEPGNTDTPGTENLELERLTQIQSALEDRLDQVESTAEDQWTAFEEDARRLMNEVERQFGAVQGNLQ